MGYVWLLAQGALLLQYSALLNPLSARRAVDWMLRVPLVVAGRIFDPAGEPLVC